MVNPVDRRKLNTVVAVLTYVSGLNMRGILAGSNDAIMAGTTVPKNLGVIDRQHRRKHGCAVAVLANVGCLHVGLVFAGRQSPVVTAYAIGGIRGVIERRRQPCSTCVAVIAGVITGNVRRMFACRSDTIMA